MRLKSVNTPSFGHLDLFGEVEGNCSKTNAVLLLFFHLVQSHRAGIFLLYFLCFFEFETIRDRNYFSVLDR